MDVIPSFSNFLTSADSSRSPKILKQRRIEADGVVTSVPGVPPPHTAPLIQRNLSGKSINESLPAFQWLKKKNRSVNLTRFSTKN